MGNQQLAIATPQNNQITINDKARELTTRLRFMIANGKKLDDNEVFALAQYCAATDLNPFAGEAYYLPGKGPCPGIVGWRKKAMEQLIYECEANHLTDPQNFWCETRAATTEEAVFDPAKDIAVHITLRDSISNKTWRRAYFETAREMKSLGMEATRADVIQFVGPEPVWTGVGVVYGSENFGGDKMDRHERAAKRAEKLAIRKRFPRVNLPEPSGAEVDYVDMQFEERPASTETQIMGDLGFEIDAPKQSAPVALNGKPAAIQSELTGEPIAAPSDWDAATIAAMARELNIVTNRVKNALNLSNLPFTATLEDCRGWMAKYKSFRDDDFTPQEAAEKANG